MIIISIKPFIYTYNYLLAKYFIIIDKKENAEKYILRGINYNPSTYRLYKSSEYLLKAACVFKNERLLNVLDDKSLIQIKEEYKDNFYFQNIYGNLDSNRNWYHLDNVSYSFLKDKKYNKLTQSILNKLETNFSEEFLGNLLEFLYWRGNTELAGYIITNYNIKNFEWIKPNNSIDYMISIRRLDSYMQKKYSTVLEKKLIPSADFSTENSYSLNWDFSNHSNREPFGEGSFFVDLYKINQNFMVKIFNLFLNNNARSVARGGIWFKEKIELSDSYYVLSFDYWLKTGQEKPRFWLADGIRIPWLDKKNRRWIKVIYILNNSKRKVEFVQPLIRIFGLGSMYVDNVIFSKIQTGNIDFEEPYHIHYLFYELE
jgi:hypothetical protein